MVGSPHKSQKSNKSKNKQYFGILTWGQSKRKPNNISLCFKMLWKNSYQQRCENKRKNKERAVYHSIDSTRSQLDSSVDPGTLHRCEDLRLMLGTHIKMEREPTASRMFSSLHMHTHGTCAYTLCIDTYNNKFKNITNGHCYRLFCQLVKNSFRQTFK